MPMERIVFHIDVNSAFLSRSAKQLLEKWYEKDIRDYVSVVWVDETRKCMVLATSIPAKKKGIKTAMNLWEAKAKDPNLIVVKPDHDYYKKCSDKLMNLLKKLFKNFQQYSIDECFVEYTPEMQRKYWDAVDVAHDIREYIAEKLGFTVNIWIWNNKFLAKMASDFEKPNKVHTLYHYEIRDKMWPLPIKDLFMCWSKTESILKWMWVRTIWDLVNISRDKLVNKLWNHWKLMYDYCRWIDDSKVENKYDDRKSIWASSITKKDTSDRDYISSFFEWFCYELSLIMKDKNLVWKKVTVQIRYADYTVKTHQKKLFNYVNQPIEIYNEAMNLFDELWNKKAVNLVWVSVWDLVDKKLKQVSLF